MKKKKKKKKKKSINIQGKFKLKETTMHEINVETGYYEAHCNAFTTATLGNVQN